LTVVLRLSTAATMATAMQDAIMAYSMEVAPDSQFKKEMNIFMNVSFQSATAFYEKAL
jgi:hypothetical protein